MTGYNRSFHSSFEIFSYKFFFTNQLEPVYNQVYLNLRWTCYNTCLHYKYDENFPVILGEIFSRVFPDDVMLYL